MNLFGKRAARPANLRALPADVVPHDEHHRYGPVALRHLARFRQALDVLNRLNPELDFLSDAAALDVMEREAKEALTAIAAVRHYHRQEEAKRLAKEIKR